MKPPPRIILIGSEVYDMPGHLVKVDTAPVCHRVDTCCRDRVYELAMSYVITVYKSDTGRACSERKREERLASNHSRNTRSRLERPPTIHRFVYIAGSSDRDGRRGVGVATRPDRRRLAQNVGPVLRQTTRGRHKYYVNLCAAALTATYTHFLHPPSGNRILLLSPHKTYTPRS